MEGSAWELKLVTERGQDKEKGAWGGVWGCWRLLGGQDGGGRGLKGVQKKTLEIRDAT